MRKFQVVFNELAEVRSQCRNGRTTKIKAVLGDSTTNNRTLTVNQVIRYLRLTKRKTLANRLETVSEILKPVVLARREIRSSLRTDAVDINELVTVYREKVMNGRMLRNTLGKALRGV